MGFLQVPVLPAEELEVLDEAPSARAIRVRTSVTIAAFTVLYLLPTLSLARYKLLWDDEFFTLYLSRAGSWHDLLRALATGADQHPPLFYLVSHLSMGLFGQNQIGLRFPAILGFWLMCVCLYFILRPITSSAWAWVGMLFPVSTKFYYYAAEARGYALVLGFTALALLCWFRITEYRRRELFLPLLAFSLAAAASSHYYAVAVTASLAIAEGARSLYRRKIDVAVWMAFGATLIPLIAFLPQIRSARGYSTNFWAKPSWPDAFIFYKNELASGALPLLGLVGAMLFAYEIFGKRKLRTRETPKVDLTPWQATAVLCLSGVPVIVMIGAKLVTKGYADRYAIPALVGVTVLLSYVLSRMAPQRGISWATAALSILMLCYQISVQRLKFVSAMGNLTRSYEFLEHAPDGPLAVIDYTEFHQLSFYAPRSLASRVVYPADPPLAVKLIQQDTMDRGLLDLNEWFPLDVVPVNTFLSRNKGFLAFGAINLWSWQTYELPAYGRTSLIGRVDEYTLFSVQDAKAPSLTDKYDKSFDPEHMLFKTLPSTGPSTCVLYFGEGSCPRL